MKRYRYILQAAFSVAIFALIGLVPQAWAYDNIVDDEGGVRVAVKPEVLAPEGPVKFAISLNTHSVPLVQDLTAVAELRDDQGRSYRPEKWEGSPPGGHHRRGTLIFPALQDPVQSVTLIIRDVADVPERTFSWQVQP